MSSFSFMATISGNTAFGENAVIAEYYLMNAGCYIDGEDN